MAELTVQPYDSPGRYLVGSTNPKREGEHYLADLLAWGTRGECSCEDWTIRIGPHFREGTEPPKPRCKHLQAAREAMLDDVLRRMIDLTTTTQPHAEQ